MAILLLMVSSASAANFQWTNPPENDGKAADSPARSLAAG